MHHNLFHIVLHVLKKRESQLIFEQLIRFHGKSMVENFFFMVSGVTKS